MFIKNGELLTSVNFHDLKKGYVEQTDQYICVCCGQIVEKGVIYPAGEALYEAGKFIQWHIQEEHGSVLDYLLTLDKGITGLTDMQRNLLLLFAEGLPDNEIQKRLAVGSASTIRNHRFLLREKERQARVFLAIMELLSQTGNKQPSSRRPASSDEASIIHKYFPQGTDGAISRYPARRQNHRKLVLSVLIEKFEHGKGYSEQEVNDILETVYEDYAMLRRELVDYGYMDRKPDGSEYWRLESKKKEGEAVSRRKELQQAASEIKTEAGVFQIRNKVNGKLWVESSRNLKKMNGQRFQLEMGSHTNKGLQQEWNQFGAESFEFSVLELMKQPAHEYVDEKRELKRLKDEWLSKLQPFGDKGYHSPKEEASLT